MTGSHDLKPYYWGSVKLKGFSGNDQNAVLVWTHAVLF